VVSAKIPGKGTWYRVILGNYATRSQALEARKLLLSRRDVDYVGVLKVGH
jgi:cell division protein FtsN